MSSNNYFILKLISIIFFIFTAYLPNGCIIKIVALITLLIAINLESIKKLWFKYKNKMNDNQKNDLENF